MTDSNDMTYYRSRAETARRMAAAAISDHIRAIHLEMADRYDMLAQPVGSRRATLGVVSAQ